MSETDTIAAIATPPGRGGVGIVRVSGPDAKRIAGEIAGTLPAPREAALRTFRDADGAAMDHGLVIVFPAPRSYTGEDVVEFHGHGGPMVMDGLLGRILALGARLAEAGEFTRRAFINDRMDLSQAEAVADLIEAGSQEAARAALRSMEGAFADQVRALTEAVTALRVYVEASIDFADEDDIEPLADETVTRRLADISARFDAIHEQARRGRLLSEGMTVVLAGRPNAGKSSIMNRLAEVEAAIVTDVPGTTRDVLRHAMQLHGMPLELVDTAGLRESGDAIEQEGVRRARDAIARADRVLVILDEAAGETRPSADVTGALPEDLPVTWILNKVDLSGGEAGPVTVEEGAPPAFRVSALTGAGMDALTAHLEAVMGWRGADTGTLSARRRHLDALARARDHMDAARTALADGQAGEIMAEELRCAGTALGEITGEVTTEDLLGRIFAEFCVGK